MATGLAIQSAEAEISMGMVLTMLSLGRQMIMVLMLLTGKEPVISFLGIRVGSSLK